MTLCCTNSISTASKQCSSEGRMNHRKPTGSLHTPSLSALSTNELHSSSLPLVFLFLFLSLYICPFVICTKADRLRRKINIDLTLLYPDTAVISHFKQLSYGQHLVYSYSSYILLVKALQHDIPEHNKKNKLLHGQFQEMWYFGKYHSL